MANARAQAAAEQDAAVARCQSSAAAVLVNARAHAENRCERLMEGFVHERAQLQEEQAVISEFRDKALGMQAQVDEFVEQYEENTKRIIVRECTDVKEHEQDLLENAEAVAWHEEGVVSELRRELLQAKLQGDSGIVKQRQKQFESTLMEPMPEYLETLRKKAASDPFRVGSLAFGAPAADAGVGTTRRAIPGGNSSSHSTPWSVNFADEESSEESVGEEAERRRAVVKPIDLGRPPTGPGVQSWLAEVYVNCCAASNRSRRRTMRFLKGVEKAPTYKTLEFCSRKWERFDAELAAACFRFASGEVLRKLKMYRDALQRRGLDVSGRAALWFVLQKYVVEVGALQQVGLSRLMGLTFSGDLGLFLDSLDKILTELTEPASEDLVSTIVVPQLREASKTKTYHSLAVDIDIFDRATTGAPEKSIEFFYRCARECLARIDRETMRTSLTKVSAVAPARPKGNAAMPCYAWIRGECKLGDKCRYEHDPKGAPKSSGVNEKGNKGKVKSGKEAQPGGGSCAEVLQVPKRHVRKGQGLRLHAQQS